MNIRGKKINLPKNILKKNKCHFSLFQELLNVGVWDLILDTKHEKKEKINNVTVRKLARYLGFTQGAKGKIDHEAILKSWVEFYN